MSKKNPFIAGLLNVLIPGLGHLYLGRWPGCILWAFLYIAAGGVLIFLANYAEKSGHYQSGLPIIIAGFLYAFLLFSDGVTFANRQNKKTALVTPDTPKTDAPEDTQTKLKKLQEMFNAGLITEQDYENKKADLLAKM